MATLYISEFTQGVSGIGTTWAPMFPSRPLTNQKLAIGAVSVQSAAFNTRTRAVRLATDTSACYVVFGDNPTATTDGIYIPVGSSINLAICPGEKVAVIQG